MEVCPICLDKKEVFLFFCKKEKVCKQCWEKANLNPQDPNKCPVCKECSYRVEKVHTYFT